MSGRNPYPLPLIALLLILSISTVHGDQIVGMESTQVQYTRSYLASQRFFERIESEDISQLPTVEQVANQKSRSADRLNFAVREYAGFTAASYGMPIAAVTLPVLLKRNWLLSKFATLPWEAQQVIAGLTPLGMLIPALPAFYASTAIYFALFPPTLPERELIIAYGSKRHLLPASTQSYIENEVFYSFWQSPSSAGVERIHKILDKALRLPVYIREQHYTPKAVDAALRNFPDKVIERLDRFARTEILYQKMSPRPGNRHPIYFQGAPGTGKTHAAHKLAEAMGTTLASVTLDGASIDDIVGTPFESYDAKAGRLLDAIIANTNSINDINHQNQILLIDEFDRLLTSDDKRSEEVLSFMLKLLDPTKRHFYSPYLKTTITLPDIIILAGNQDIRELARSNPRLEALASRLETLTFAGFSKQAKLNIARESIIPKFEKSFRSLGGEMEAFNFPDEAYAELKAFIDNDDDPGLRSMEKLISSQFEFYLDRI
ncbi:AAA family ATPase [Parendozoicomonas haliclonae]|uniref:Lon protease n=1 Tax=Parendozoicomonas haliclonae TaxID=1960125 RepID=A0A1X7AQP4_9GAMM|nr:AAA family ATPase [Parendozoicomonas haliclonae]SMA50418.1 Lon protease [Parendozoicomonas haliclonae]